MYIKFEKNCIKYFFLSIFFINFAHQVKNIINAIMVNTNLNMTTIYNLCKKLYELGFDDTCEYTIELTTTENSSDSKYNVLNIYTNNSVCVKYKNIYTIPTVEQIRCFIRTTLNTDIVIMPTYAPNSNSDATEISKKYQYDIISENPLKLNVSLNNKQFITYENALLDACQYIIENYKA